MGFAGRMGASEDGAVISEYAPGVKLSDHQLVGNMVARDE